MLYNKKGLTLSCLQGFRMHLFKKDEVYTSSISNNKPEVIFVYTSDALGTVFYPSHLTDSRSKLVFIVLKKNVTLASPMVIFKGLIESFSNMTTTARKLFLENKHLGNCDCTAIIPSCSHFTMLVKKATTGMVCVQPLN